jgi:NitT/TauT family transport system ATP-binding protein
MSFRGPQGLRVRYGEGQADRVIILTARPGRLLDSVNIDMSRPRNVISPEFERYRGLFVERLRAEVTKAFQEQELAEMLDTRIK